jgi:hypothetical protein
VNAGPKRSTKRAEASKSKAPVNVPGASRNRLRALVENKPDANYEIVHGVVMLLNPDNVGKPRDEWVEPHQVAYYPEEVIRLSWADAAPMLKRGVVVEVGEELVIMTTSPEIIERAKGFEPDEPSNVRKVRADIHTASQVLYDADSSQRGMGGLRAAPR